jgi:two-component system response regulator
MEPRNPVIVIFDEDPNDLLILKEAFEICRPNLTLILMDDGKELLQYLHRQDHYANVSDWPEPDMIVIDPGALKADGFGIIRDLKSNPALKKTPVLAWARYYEENMVNNCYDCGVNTVISKPDTFDKMVITVKRICDYWLQTINGQILKAQLRTNR